MRRWLLPGAFEFFPIETCADGVFHVAKLGGSSPIEFKLAQANPNSAHFEYPKHDHRKIITCRLEGASTPIAAIEGEPGDQHRKQEFRFECGAKSVKQPPLSSESPDCTRPAALAVFRLLARPDHLN